MEDMGHRQIVEIQKIEKLADHDTVELGEWFLLDKTKEHQYYLNARYGKEDEVLSGDGKALVCSDSFESNLVIFKSNCKSYRVLNKDLGDVVTPINKADAIELIQNKINKQQELIMLARDNIQEVIALISMSGTSQSSSTTVAVASKNAIMQQSTALKEVHAKNIEKYNQEIREHVGVLHEVTQYYSLPATVGISNLTKTKGLIDEKLHELNLYGGLDEKEVDIATGGVVNESAPIHIFQNLKYMDVEAIIGYESGGIGLGDVKSFNQWLAIPENRDRILPESKSIIAIKTRKYREFTVGYFQPENSTYLYMRNGENIRSLKTNLSISGTLLATENEITSDIYVKKTGSSDNLSKNFIFLSINEYDTLASKAELFKPLWLNLLLTGYKEKLRYLTSAIDYVEHRRRILGDVGVPRNRDIMRGDERRNIEYKPRPENEFHEGIEKQKESNEQVKIDIQTIIDAIENNFANPNLSMPRIYESRHIQISDHERGFIDEDGVEHLMGYSINEYHDKLIELTDQFSQKSGLYFPNNADVSSYNTEPFSVLRALSSYSLMNEDNYFFDDLKTLSWQKYKRQNDLAVLIQGILDRTTFFGYTKANLFKDGYEDKIKLVHDKDKGLYDGDMPNFKAFIEKCNENSRAGDLFVGHQVLWLEKEREKLQDDRFYDTIDIPKFLAAEKVVNKRDGRTMVSFRWEVERDWSSQAKSPTRVHRFECDIKSLLNVSHYKQGDCDVFAKDPRCRDLYPKWGGLIMAAERHYQK